MSVITLEELKQQLLSSENELEAAKSAVYRGDGIIQLLKFQIKMIEDKAQAQPVDETPQEG